MKVSTEKLGDNLAKIIIEVPNQDFKKECENVYNKNKGKYNIPGFRKGHADKATIEKMYGKGVFFEDACDNLINSTYPQALKESGLEVISRPKISVSKIGENDDLVYEAEVAIVPDFKLPKYKGIELEKEKVEVAKEEIEERLKQEQEKNAVIETKDGEIQDGDIAVIDFEGFVDNVPFQGGKGSDYSLNIGSHTFVDTFEEQLIGKKKGDKVDVKVHFPKNYHKDLADKDALFKVAIKDVKGKTLPEIDDEFASMVSQYENLKDYKAEIKKNIEKLKEEDLTEKLSNAAMEKIVKDTKLELAKEAIDSEVDYIVEDANYQLKRQGLTLDKYLQILNKSLDEYKKSLEAQAERNIKSRLILDKIAKEDKVEASDEMAMQYFEDMALQYGLDLDRVRERVTDEEKQQAKDSLKYKAVLKYIVDNANIKEVSPKKKTTKTTKAKEEKE